MKKIISLALVLCTMLLLSLSATAIDIDKLVNDQLVSITASEREGVIEVLNFVEGMKETFQLENVDFDELEIGNRIRTYEATETGLSEVGYVYPIIYDDAVVAIATPLCCGKFQISTKDAQAIQESGFKDFALIYDKDGTYIFNGYSVNLVSGSIYPIESRVSISDLLTENTDVVSTLTTGVELTDVRNTHSLDYQRSNEISSITGSSYEYLNVVHVAMVPDTKTCWAASVAMISNFLKGTSLTAHDVASAYHNGADYSDKRGVNLNDTAYLLRRVYDCDYSAYGSNSLSSANPSDGIILRNIRGGYPVLGRMNVSGVPDQNHAVVIYGIDVLGGYISIDDPQSGTVTSYRCYHAIHESNSYYEKYVYTSNDLLMYLDGFAGKWISDVN